MLILLNGIVRNLPKQFFFPAILLFFCSFYTTFYGLAVQFTYRYFLLCRYELFSQLIKIKSQHFRSNRMSTEKLYAILLSILGLSLLYVGMFFYLTDSSSKRMQLPKKAILLETFPELKRNSLAIGFIINVVSVVSFNRIEIESKHFRRVTNGKCTQRV